MIATATRMSFNYSHKEYYMKDILIMTYHMNINRHQHAHRKKAHQKTLMYKNATHKNSDQVQKLKQQGPATHYMNWILDIQIKRCAIEILLIMQWKLNNTC
jgi:hypothetical protein